MATHHTDYRSNLISNGGLMKTLSEKEWIALGESLFGKDMNNWKFKCPVCGNVATPEDFRKFKDQGADPNSATCECIGRYLPKEQRGGFCSDHANTKIKQPCDYAGYGLFRLSPVEVVREDGRIHCFAFAGDE